MKFSPTMIIVMWSVPAMFAILTIAIGATTAQQVRVNIAQGLVAGIVSRTERGSQFYSFLGIPYARPPIDELRFKDPIKHPGWSGEMEATEYGSVCPQTMDFQQEVEGDEDCLSINVYTPQLPAVYPAELLPVMFYIHGGMFMGGSSNVYGAAKLLSEPIVLVTVNYRLGVLGFLSTSDEQSPGNYGLMDLIMALQWVQENVASFGGDSQRVTIFGDSSGGAMVSYLILSPLASGLFWAAITQSGCALCKWAFDEYPLETARVYASEMNCDVTDSVSIVNCLSQASSDDIVTLQARLLSAQFNFKTVPTVDLGLRSTPFLPDTPERLLQSGEFSKIPLVSGVDLNEGLFFVLRRLLGHAKNIVLDPTYMERVIIPDTIMTHTEYNPDKVNLLKNFYFRNVVNFQNMTEVIPPLIDVNGDIMVNSCNDKHVKLHSVYAPTYMYVFSHRGATSHSDKYVANLQAEGIDSPMFHTGPSHADDINYLFNMPNYEPNYLVPADQRVQEILINLWTTFARTGNPNMQPNSAGDASTYWKGLRPMDLSYFDISLYPHLGKDFRQFQLAILDLVDRMTPAPASSTVRPERYTNPREPYFTVTWIMVGIAAIFLIVCIVLAAILYTKTRKGGYSTDSLMRF